MSAISRIPYSYAVLRYVHDIAAGEFINVGVVVFSPRAAYVGAKFRQAYGRVKKAFPSMDTEAFRSRMRRLQSIFDAIAAGDIGCLPQSDQGMRSSSLEDLLHSVLRPDDSSLQWSPAGSGISKDLPLTLATLHDRFVTKYDPDVNGAQRKDDDVWKHFRTALEKRNVLGYLEEKVIEVADDAVKFEHAWKNGAWNCYEPLSFDLSSEASIREKAHRWLGQVASIQDASERFNVYFLVGRPSDSKLSVAFDQAVSILRKAPASTVVEESKADEFSTAVAKAIAENETHPH